MNALQQKFLEFLLFLLTDSEQGVVRFADEQTRQFIEQISNLLRGSGAEQLQNFEGILWGLRTAGEQLNRTEVFKQVDTAAANIILLSLTAWVHLLRRESAKALSAAIEASDAVISAHLSATAALYPEPPARSHCVRQTGRELEFFFPLPLVRSAQWHLDEQRLARNLNRRVELLTEQRRRLIELLLA